MIKAYAVFADKFKFWWNSQFASILGLSRKFAMQNAQIEETRG